MAAGFSSAHPPIPTHPRAYEILTSLDGKKWDPPVASGQGDDPDNIIVFQPVTAKFLRIKLTGDTEKEEEKAPWSMKELKIYGLAPKDGLVN